MTSINTWPAEERPRERLIASGAAALSDAELLAVFLRTGSRGVNAVDLARNLLSRFGSLSALLSAPRSALKGTGLGDAKYAAVQAAIELARRSTLEPLAHRDVFTSPEKVSDYLMLWLRPRSSEVFAVLFLDSQNRLIAAEEMFKGTLSQTAVYPREILRRTIELNAAAVILAHNHPSGVAEPSVADEGLTRTLSRTLAQIDVKVVDHMIVAGNVCYSFAQHGRMPAARP